jgi:type IV pilus assembly protein PilE
MKSISKGFTLIELMVVVAVIAILTSVALPSYLGSVERAKRAEAKAVLGQMQTWMERYFTENGRYNQNQFGQALDTVNLAYPTSPGGGATARYTITIENVSASTYTLVAAPVNEMAGDKCGSLVVTHLGVRSNRGGTVAGGEVLRECWGR